VAYGILPHGHELSERHAMPNHSAPLVVAFLLPLALVSPPASSQRAAWPAVAPTKVTVFYPLGRSASLSVEALGQNGRSLYRLDCHTFEFNSKEFNYSGDFECRLYEVPVDRSKLGTLLADSESVREWDTRGRFLREDIEGPCGAYPEYGLTRHFRLRGMRLTLSMSDVRLWPKPANEAERLNAPPALESFRFMVEIKQDPQAASSMAELPRVQNPVRRTRPEGEPVRDCTAVQARP